MTSANRKSPVFFVLALALGSGTAVANATSSSTGEHPTTALHHYQAPLRSGYVVLPPSTARHDDVFASRLASSLVTHRAQAAGLHSAEQQTPHLPVLRIFGESARTTGTSGGFFNNRYSHYEQAQVGTLERAGTEYHLEVHGAAHASKIQAFAEGLATFHGIPVRVIQVSAQPKMITWTVDEHDND